MLGIGRCWERDYEGFSLRRCDFDGGGLKLEDRLKFRSWCLGYVAIDEGDWIEGLLKQFKLRDTVIVC